MTAHLLKLIWNRKRRNLLLMMELFFAFLVLLFVVGVVSFYAQNYRQSLGFSYDDVWSISVAANQSGPGGEKNAAAAETTRQILNAARDFPQVEAAAVSFTGPYDMASWLSQYEANGRSIDYLMNPVTDEYAKALGIEVTRGRWFSHEDDGTAIEPVIVNESLGRMAFGDVDPIGKTFPPDTPSSAPDPGNPPRRVVGVIRDFRQYGEFDAARGYAFLRNQMTDVPRLMVVKVRPGTAVAFEETLTRRLQDVAKDWSFKVQALSELRAANHRERLAPLIAVGVVAGFLLLMVAVGLTGVLWQNVTERTREIGLRRAMGATGRSICLQIIGEVMVMAGFAIVLATALVLQLPFLAASDLVTPSILATSLTFSIVVLQALVALSALCPARLATRVRPAEALHYE